jgi:superfamily II DNA or RNA helicase
MNREQVQEEALLAIQNKKNCSVVLGTGVGKTLVALNHIDQFTTIMMKLLVVAPKKSIFQSWKDDAIKFKKEYLLDRITFTTYLSLNKHEPSDYDIVYLDEMHSLLDSHRVFLESFNGKIIGLTGTPPKYHDSEKGMLVREFCPVVYTFDSDLAIKNGILNDYKIIVHKLDLSNNKTLKVELKNKSFITSEVLNYNYWSNRLASNTGPAHITRIMRMKAIMSYDSKMKYAKELFNHINSKCILFANDQKQADILCKNSYHSNNPDSEDNLQKFKDDTILKLSCVLQLNEGVNIPNLKQGIIMHAYGNERKASQRIGRLLRLNPEETAIVHILCYMNTVDEKWVKEALENFNQNKIVWKNYNLSV